MVDESAPKVPAKAIKSQIKTLRKDIAVEKKKTAKVAKTASAKTESLSKEMDKLKNDVQNLSKKKTSKKQLSEYNLFMRRQLNDGKTFKQAVAAWKAYKKGKPLVQTKVVKKTIVKRIKSKPKIITKIRTIVRNVAAKPKIVTRTRTIVRQAKPKIITRTIVKKGPVRTVVKTIRVPAAQPSATRQADYKVFETMISQLKKTGVESMHLSDEELAVRIVSLYFEEIARMGFKRQLELDDVINAYYHALARLKGKKAEQTPVVVQNQPIVVENKQ